MKFARNCNHEVETFTQMILFRGTHLNVFRFNVKK